MNEQSKIRLRIAAARELKTSFDPVIFDASLHRTHYDLDPFTCPIRTMPDQLDPEQAPSIASTSICMLFNILNATTLHCLPARSSIAFP